MKEKEKQFQIKMKNAIANGIEFFSQDGSRSPQFCNIPNDLEDDILLHNAWYMKKIELGRQVDDILNRNPHITRETLPEHF